METEELDKIRRRYADAQICLHIKRDFVVPDHVSRGQTKKA
jgi:hypothetical protein